MALEGGSEILLVVGVVYAVLGLESGKAVHRAVGGERKDSRGLDLVEVLGSRVSIVEADQVLGSSAVRWDGGEGAARRTRVLVDGIHHVRGPVLIHVVCKEVRDVSNDSGGRSVEQKQFEDLYSSVVQYIYIFIYLRGFGIWCVIYNIYMFVFFCLCALLIFCLLFYHHTV